MNEQDKQLLLKDLCARLPYGVIIYHKNVNCDYNLVCVFEDGRIGVKTKTNNIYLTPTSVYECIPYLRPMESMTEEEEETWKFLCSTSGYDINERYMEDGIGWLHKHHLDYRNLIRKGLALEAPEGMYINS